MNLACSSNNKLAIAAGEPFTAYLFTYFTGNSKTEESIHFAISTDGYHFRALNNNQPILNSALISSTGGVRDPHILRGANGTTFYMVATDMVSANGWNSNRAMVLLKSYDLISWTSSVVNIPKTFEKFKDVNRVWAPQTFYDEQEKKYMVYWSMRAGNEPDKIYYSYANPDFTLLETEPKQLFYEPANGATIDGDIVFKDGLYHLFFKTEGRGSGIKVAVADQLTGDYKLRDWYVHLTKDPVEGAGVFKLNDGSGYILMYDVYTKGRYQFTKTTDLQHFKVVDSGISMNFHPRHGTIIPITQKEAERLEKKWLIPTDVLHSLQLPALKTRILLIDSPKNEMPIALVSAEAGENVNPPFFNYPVTKTMLDAKHNNRQAITSSKAGKEAITRLVTTAKLASIHWHNADVSIRQTLPTPERISLK